MAEERIKELEKFINDKIDFFEENEKKSRNLKKEEWKMVVEASNSDVPALKSSASTLAIMAIERYAFRLLTDRGVSLKNEDFTQSIYVGILSALPAYDPDKATATTYFKPYILSEIMDGFKFETSSLYETRYQQLKKMNVKRAASELEKQGIINPTAEDIHAYIQKQNTSKKNSLNVRIIRKTMESLQPVAGLDELLGIASDKSATDPEKVAVQNARAEDIREAIDKLDDRSKFIISTMLEWETLEGNGKKKIPFAQLYKIYTEQFDPNATQEAVKRSQRTAIQRLKVQVDKLDKTKIIKIKSRKEPKEKIDLNKEKDIFTAIETDNNFFED